MIRIKWVIILMFLSILFGVIAEKIDLPLKLQMWGSFYVLPNKKHIFISCYPNNKLYGVTNGSIDSGIDLVCYPKE